MEKQNKEFLYGLNTLRFLAAFFIIAMHIQNNQTRIGIPSLPQYAFLYKGAVSFFFTLSGFLITYIRTGEYIKTGTIDVKRFFRNRFFRLAPLYYLVIILGLIFYWLVVPKIGMQSNNDYDLILAIFLYLFFLPNVMNSMFQVGGALNVSWSIGAQEQFYFLLIPLMKKKMHVLVKVLWILVFLFILLNILNSLNIFGFSKELQNLVHTLRFHYMAIGALLGYYLKTDRKKLLSLWVFSKKWLQFVLTLLLVGWYSWNTDSALVKATITFPLSFLYGWVIINVSANPKNILKIDNFITDWIGQRTYGIYMFHMFVVYSVSFVFSKTHLFFDNIILYTITFYTLVFGVTTLIAHFTHKYVEIYVMNWLKRGDYKKILSSFSLSK